MAADRRTSGIPTMTLAGVATLVAVVSGGYQLFSPKDDINRVDKRLADAEQRFDEKLTQLRKDMEWRYATKEILKLHVDQLRELDHLNGDRTKEALLSHQSRLIELERASRDVKSK